MKRRLHFFSFYLFPFFVFLAGGLAASAQATLGGKITGGKNHLPVVGATISFSDLNISAASDSLGQYKLSRIPDGYYLIKVSATGYASKIESITIKGRIKKDFQLEASAIELNEVVVTGVIAATASKNAPVSITPAKARMRGWQQRSKTSPATNRTRTPRWKSRGG